VAVVVVSVPPILRFREKKFEKNLKKSILKQVVVCLCAVYISEKFEKNQVVVCLCAVYISDKFENNSRLQSNTILDSTKIINIIVREINN
jgi:hypothetical protein